MVTKTNRTAEIAILLSHKKDFKIKVVKRGKAIMYDKGVDTSRRYNL